MAPAKKRKCLLGGKTIHLSQRTKTIIKQGRCYTVDFMILIAPSDKLILHSNK